MFLDGVRDHDGSCKYSVPGHIDYCSYTVTAFIGNSHPFHQLSIARKDCGSFYFCLDAVSGNFLTLTESRGIQFRLAGCLIGLPDRCRDRVGGIGFSQSCQPQQLLLLYSRRENLRHLKLSLGECSRLVKYNRIHLRQRFQIIASLYKHSVSRCSTDSSEEAKRHRDNKGTGTGDNEEDARSLNPFPKVFSQEDRRHDCEKHGRDHYYGSIISGKTCDEVLHLGFFAAGIFHQLQNPGHCGVVEFLCDLYAEKPAAVDTAAYDLRALAHSAGNGFSCQSRGIYHGFTGNHTAV